MHNLQASASAVSCYDRNAWCFRTKSYEMVQVFMIHISHL